MLAQISAADQSETLSHMQLPSALQKRRPVLVTTDTHRITILTVKARPHFPPNIPSFRNDGPLSVRSESRIDGKSSNIPIAEFQPYLSDHFPVPFPQPPSKAPPSAFTIYGYSFFRARSAKSVLSTIGQYGGSQSGFVADLFLNPPHEGQVEPPTALQIRGAIAHDVPEEWELAAGLRWKPARTIPMSLSVERRFRNGRKDAFAAYVAGGTSIQLPLQSNLESYVQAGLLSGKQGGPFFDFTARVDRKLGTTPLVAGMGIWGGGQSNLFRIDAGPTIKNDFSISDTQFRISADWRFHIAGDASPKSGPAMTLSTSF